LAIRSNRHNEVLHHRLCHHSRPSLPGDQPFEARQCLLISLLSPGDVWQKLRRSPFFGRWCRVLIQVISSVIKFHIEKIQIRFALLGDEWLYIKLQAIPFSSCIDEVSCCACG
jgi:hypothetical protein